MSMLEQFEEIEAWRRASDLFREIYQVSGRGAFAKDFGLLDQMRRASVSIMSNMTERFDRSGSGEFAQFLAIAKGSAGEVRSQLYVAPDRKYIAGEDFSRLLKAATDTAKMIAGLMNYLRKSGVKGTKYKIHQT